MAEISRVGPKGYEHGWVFVGAPGVGAHVFHSHHGHGTVTAHSGTHATVRFDSGAEHSFEAAPGSGTPRLEPRKLGSMAHGQTPQQVSAGQSNAAALMATMKAKQEGRTRMAKAGIPVPPAQGDMKPGAAGDEYVQASGLMYAGKYAEASAALAKAITAANERRDPQAAKRLAAYKVKLDKALYATAPKAARHDAYAERTRELCAQAGLVTRAETSPGDVKDTERLHEYWVHGEGAAKIRWGEPDDFARCVTHLGKYIRDPEGYCNLAHKAATGMYPSQHAAMEKKATGRSAVTTMTERADAKPYGDVKYADPKNGKYPIDTEAHARSAWSYVNMPKNASQYPMNGVTLSEVKGRIMAACKKFGIDVSSDSSSASRTDPVYFRTYELEDIHIVRAAQGDSTGRLVEAYATAFNAPAEIQDFEGHYIEEIDPAAFNKVLADIGRSRAGFGKVKVMYNHGMTIHGTPSERGSMPIATPVDIRPEARGLLTLARYSDTPFADEVLENIRNGSITAQSFTGRIVRSDPQLRRGDRHRPRNGELPRVRRTELGLKEFGPTPFEAYSGAEILGVRMSAPGAYGDQDPDESDEALPPDEEAAAGEPLARTGGDEHSARYHQHQLYRLTSEEKRKAAGLDW